MISVKNVKSKPAATDGTRIYVDRLWTDGAFTRDVRVNTWNLEVAPSYDLWRFHYQPEKWDDFVARYRDELQSSDKKKALTDIHNLAKSETVTLLWGNGTDDQNCALALQDLLAEMG